MDVFATAPRDEDVVEKLPAIIGVKLAQRHRKALADEVDARADARVALAPDRLALGPTGGDIDGDQRRHIEALDGLAAMADEIGLKAAGPNVLPVAKGADGDLRGEGGVPGPSGGEAPAVAPMMRPQDPVDRRRAEVQEQRPEWWGDLEHTMPLEGSTRDGKNGASRLPHR